MIEARRVGIPRDVFWSSTPRELRIEFDAARRRAEDEYDRDVVQAWRAVQIFVRTQNDRRMPSLKSLLTAHGRRPAARQQTLAQQRSVLHLLSAKYGIPLRQKVTHGREHHDWNPSGAADR